MKTSGAVLALSCVGSCVYQASAFFQPTSAFTARQSTLASSSVTRSCSGLKMVASKEELLSMKKDIVALLDKSNAAPILVRLAWHDSGTYDHAAQKEWPTCGGANGSIRFSPEIEHGANAGLPEGFKLLKQIKAKYDTISWADTLQMASATAIEEAGGPKIDMKYGRVDAAGPEGCTPDGRLPAAAKPFPDGSPTPQDHIRRVFYRMGFDDQGIVALSGAHTLGRAFPERSGFGKESTKYTDNSSVIRVDGKKGHGRTGGQSWTKQWLKFDNSYYASVPEDDDDLLKLETDTALFQDEKMRPIALKYKNDEAAFFADYAAAHKKLSELGSKFEPAEGIKID